MWPFMLEITEFKQWKAKRRGNKMRKKRWEGKESAGYALPLLFRVDIDHGQPSGNY